MANLSNPESEQHIQYMQHALELAKRGLLTTQPNPRVGCVIVKDNQIIGEGYHQKAGEPHAEPLALAQAGKGAKGATVYVTLEPCSHQGRTPPCADALIETKVAQVVIATLDPNPLVSGNGVEKLKAAGIKVVNRVLTEQAQWLNRGFISRMVRKKPWVQLKSAATLDGKTAAFDGESKWITGAEARHQVQLLRAESCAVITGIETVLADNPSMNVRLEDTQRQPLRVVLDSQLRLPTDAKIISDDGKLLVFTCSKDQAKKAALTTKNAANNIEVIEVEATSNGRVDLLQVLQELDQRECNQVLVEAGQQLSGAFIEQNLVDQLSVFYAGSILGDQAKGMFAFDEAVSFQQRPHFEIKSVQKIGADVLIDSVQTNSLKDCQIEH